MDTTLTKFLECSKKQQKDFNTEIIPILEGIFKLPSEQQKEFVKNNLSYEDLKEMFELDPYAVFQMRIKTQEALTKMDPQLTNGFFKNNPQVQDDRVKNKNNNNKNDGPPAGGGVFKK